MFIAYATVTILAATISGIAGVMYLIRHDYPMAQMKVKRLPQSWGPMLGLMLVGGSLGLLAGFGVPLLGILAAAGLVLYFVGALIAHLRVGSRNLANWAFFLVTMVAALAVNLGYHNPW
ncbi:MULTISPECIES: DoxX family protein [Nonomuraea]|uniref:DoxX family protein n=1 Tax=Nonomuraea mangrovi TaxID=2316207 RepID=A0ABW4SV03_9ACTN